MLQYDLNATPVGFEPTHGDRNRFQVCLLNRSDKASYFQGLLPIYVWKYFFR